MAWQDRDYSRQDRGGFSDNPLMWLLTGRVPLFRAFGAQVVLHASFIVVVALVILLGSPFGATPQDRLAFVAILFGVVLLHEFGHVFGARISGGEADEIQITPLGGLAMTMPARGPKPAFITTVCGPLVNVLICLVVGMFLYALTGYAEVGPLSVGSFSDAIDNYDPSLASPVFYLSQIYAVSYYLLLFNLLPVYPLDGGRLLHEVLWFKLGYYRSLLFATAFGMVVAALAGLWGLALIASGTGGGFLLAIIMVSCFVNCLQIHRMLKAEGPWAFQQEDEPDWSRSLAMDPDEPEKQSFLERRKQAREERAAEREAERREADERQVDEVLAKVGQSGMASLSTAERRVLERATKARNSPQRH